MNDTGNVEKPASIQITYCVTRRLNIEFLYLNLSVCTRCRETGASLEEAVSEVAGVLEATGLQVAMRKIRVESEEQARELGFASSPTIRINGQDIQPDVKESLWGILRRSLRREC